MTGSILKMIRPRTVASAVRTAVYGGVATLFAMSEAEAVVAVDAVLIGAVAADYITWFFRSIITLPGNILHGAYDSIVNIFFGWYVFGLMKIELKPPDDLSIPLAFVAFLLVGVLKMGYYSLTSIVQEMEG